MNIQRSLCQRGFTLVELMIAIAILAIAVAVAVPSFQALRANYRVRSAADALATSVMYARSEAIKRNTAIEISSRSDGWQAGWTVSVVSGADLREVTLEGLVVDGFSDDSFVIGRDGRIGETYTATVCDENELATSRIVTISFSGLTRVAQGERCGS